MTWLREHRSTALLAAGVLILGVFESYLTWPHSLMYLAARLIVSVTSCAAVLLHRVRPGWAAGLFWLGSGILWARNMDVMIVQLSIITVYYGLARWARVEVAWLWLVVTPIIGLFTGSYLYSHTTLLASVTGLSLFVETSSRPAIVFVAGAALPVITPLIVGLLLRLRARARSAEVGRESALELAAEKTYESQLARDVHDVVGHSLATILMQAESGRYTDDDPEQLKATLARIAGSARQSLVDVRSLLESTQPETTELEEVIAVVQRAGAQVSSRMEGTPRSLPPDVATVAVRVLQEMLTNALRHGSPDSEIQVQRIWRDGLTIITTNDCTPEPPPSTRGGQHREGTGLAGMQHRVHAIGGRLEITRIGSRFTVRAWLPSSAAFTTATP